MFLLQTYTLFDILSDTLWELWGGYIVVRYFAHSDNDSFKVNIDHV